MVLKIMDRIRAFMNPDKRKLDKRTAHEIVKRAYEAAKPNDQFPLIPQSLSPNAATQTGAEKIRDQARYLDENHDLTISVLDTLVGRIVGKGMNLTPMIKDKSGELMEDLNKQIKALWKKFEKSPEVTNNFNMASADRLQCRTFLRDGESLCRFITGRVAGLTHPTDVPLSLELIEPDYLPFIKCEQAKNGNNIIQGVELSKWGAPVAFHLLKTSPYEVYPLGGQGLALDTFSVRAEDILHVKFTRRLSQVRGISILHGVIRRMESIKMYEEAEQVAARVAASLTGFIEKDLELAEGVAETSDRGDIEMHPGMIFDNLQPGEKVGVVSSDRPNTGLLDFRNALLRAVAGGTMSNFSAISGYYDGTYSSQRQELVESRTGYDILRDIYISRVKFPVYERFLELALQFGQITDLTGIDEDTIFDCDISGQAIAWIDPKKEIEAFKIAKDERFLPRAGIIRLMGGDPQEVMAEIEKEQENEPEPIPGTLETTLNSDEEVNEDAESEEEQNE